MRRNIVVMVFLTGLVACTPSFAQQEAELVAKVYNVGKLVSKHSNLSYSSGRWPGTGILKEAASKAGDEAKGGFGGGAGAAGGGGGMMRIDDAVPSHVLPQMGGMGGGMAGGMGGFGGGYVDPRLAYEASFERLGIDAELHRQLLDCLSRIDAEQWEMMGGPASIAIFGDTLVIHATSAMHKKIQSMLEALNSVSGIHRSLNIDWVVSTSDQVPVASDKTDFSEALFHGSVACLNRQAVSASSGTQVNFVTGLIPVVGGTEVAHQPQTVHPLMGWLFEFRPSFVPAEEGSDSDFAAIDVAVSHTEPTDAPAESIRISDNAQIDRVSLDARSLTGTVYAKAKQWIRVGSMVHCAAGSEAGDSGKLFLFVRWQ